MRLREIITIGLMGLLTAMMMRQDAPSESGNERAITPASVTNLEHAVVEQYMRSLLAFTQDGETPPAPKPVNVTVQTHTHEPTITPEFVDKCMEVAEQINPEWAARIRGMCETSPEQFELFIRRSGRQLVGLVELRDRDPELYATKLQEMQTEARIAMLRKQLIQLHAEGRFDSQEANDLKAVLRAAVQDQVAFSLKARGDYINRLKDHVESLEKQLEKDALSFFRTVEDRYQTLLEMP